MRKGNDPDDEEDDVVKYEFLEQMAAIRNDVTNGPVRKLRVTKISDREVTNALVADGRFSSGSSSSCIPQFLWRRRFARECINVLKFGRMEAIYSKEQDDDGKIPSTKSIQNFCMPALQD